MTAMCVRLCVCARVRCMCLCALQRRWAVSKFYLSPEKDRIMFLSSANFSLLIWTPWAGSVSQKHFLPVKLLVQPVTSSAVN